MHISCIFITDTFGNTTERLFILFYRKRGLLFNGIFMFVGTLLEGISKPAKIPELLIIGRGLIGINCGKYTFTDIDGTLALLMFYMHHVYLSCSYSIYLIWLKLYCK